MGCQVRQLMVTDKLVDYGGKKPGGFTAVAFALFEEEAGYGHFGFGYLSGYRPRDGRFASSGHAAQPEDVSPVGVLDPFVNVVEKVHAGVWVAGGVVFVRVVIERSAFCSWQFREGDIAVDFFDLGYCSFDVLCNWKPKFSRV